MWLCEYASKSDFKVMSTLTMDLSCTSLFLEKIYFARNVNNSLFSLKDLHIMPK